MKALVGYTGFVGSNLAEKGGFDALYNSKNIESAFGTCPDILYYAGVPRQKFIANKYPDEDMAIIENAVENIRKINPKNVVLISTVDVYKNPLGKDEDAEMETEGLLPYGLNRLYFEKRVRELYPEALIVRLPGLYGKNIKKNFIYDYINYIPALLTDKKIAELRAKNEKIKEYYTDRGDGFFAVNKDADRDSLIAILKEVGFSALNFTDSRGVFQYYNLGYLYEHTQTALSDGVKLLNIATQPIVIDRLYEILTGEKFINHVTDNPPYYDFRTKHSQIFGGRDGYIQSAEFVYEDIKKFVEEML